MRYMLSQSTADKLKLMLGQQTPAAAQPGPGVGGGRIVLVKVLSTSAASGSGAGAQCYSAAIIDPHSGDTSPDAIGRVWLTVYGASAAAQTPTANGVYSARLSGDIEIAGDNRPRAFAVAGAAAASATPPFAVLTEATGASSWQGREVNIGSGAWSSNGSSGTDDARPFLMDGSTFTPKPTANVLLFEDSGGDLGYLPVQAADRVSGTDYPGYVSTGAQTWNGNKTFGDYVVVNSDAGAGTAFQVLTNYGGSTNFLSTVGGSNPYVLLGGSAPVQLFTYADMHSKRLVVTPAGVGGYVGGAPGQSVVGPGQATLVYPYDPVSYPNTMAFFGASGSAVLMTPSAGILTISSGIDAQTGRFTTWCDAYDYKTTEHGSPFGSYTGGTASDGAGGYYFLNGLYIASSGNPVFSIGGGTTGLTATGTNTITLGGTLAVANGGTGADLSATGPGVLVQGSSGAALSAHQSSGTGETSGFTAGSGTPVNDDSTFTGNIGSTAYNLNDVVKALKQAKLLAD